MNEQLGIEMKNFGTMTMHLWALRIEKSLLSNTSILVNRRIPREREIWHNITTSMQKSHIAINKWSIEWCLTMVFWGKDYHSLRTTTWQLDHCLAFARLPLFHFGPLDGYINLCEEKSRVLSAFKHVRFLWFCLMSSMCEEETVTTARINNLVKLFLSSCRVL